MSAVGSIITTPDSGWQRFLFSDEHIRRYGGWADSTGMICNSNYAPLITTFVGSKIRIMGQARAYTGIIQVFIDNVSYGTFSCDCATDTVLFEKTELPFSQHAVKLLPLGGGNGYHCVHCLDIDDAGELLFTPATVGDVLTAPEPGYKRITDRESGIIYSDGNWGLRSPSGRYNASLGAIGKFKFVGTKIRIIGGVPDGAYGSMSIYIDGKEYPVSSNKPWNTILAEVIGLENKIHTVAFVNTSGGYNEVDAFDIDDDAVIVDFYESNTKTSISEMTVGDRIICNYTANNGSFGVLSQLGTATTSELPKAGSIAAPNGSFYFEMVGYDVSGRKKLVADRGIQSNISWSTLNSEGLSSESGLPYAIDNKPNYTLRLLSGGVDTADGSNEWDNIIAKSTLNNTVVPGDATLWNYLNTYTITSSQWTGNTTLPTVRGGTTLTGSTYINSGDSNASYVFRPVLLVGLATECKITTVSPTHVYTAQHVSFDITANATSVTGLPVQFKIRINDVDFDSFDYIETRTIPVNLLVNGNNTIAVVSLDGEFTSVNVILEEPHRQTVQRSFTAIDGGYTTNNVTLNGAAKSTDATTGLIQTTELTNIDLKRYAGINGIKVTGTGGKYALSFDKGITWKVFNRQYTADTSKTIIPIMTSATTPSGEASQSSVWSSMYGWNVFAVPGVNFWITWTGVDALPAWVSYDFKALTMIGGYSVITTANYVATDWTYEGSNDKVNWDILDTVVGNTLVSPDEMIRILPEPANYKAYRLRITKSTGQYSNLAHISMFGVNVIGGAWQTIQASEIAEQGMSITAINSLTANELQEAFQATQLDIMAHLTGSTSLSSLTISLPPDGPPSINNVNVTPSTLHSGIVNLTADIDDAEDHVAQYRVSLNSADITGWLNLPSTPISISAPISSGLMNIGSNEILLEAKDIANQTASQTVYVTVLNNMPAKSISSVKYSRLTASLGDLDGDALSYKITLNGVVKQDWSPFRLAPVAIDFMPQKADVLYNKTNTYRVDFKDTLGAASFFEEVFIGDYYSVMFADEEDNFYSTDTGIVIKRLDIGTYAPNQRSLTYPVRVLNTTGVTLRSITVYVDQTTVPANTYIKLSHDVPAFEEFDTLSFAHTINAGEYVTFLVQMTSDAIASHGGTFKLVAVGEPA